MLDENLPFFTFTYYRNLTLGIKNN